MPEEVERQTIVTKLLDMALINAEYLKDLERLRQAINVMFTDIEGSTAYFEKYGDSAGLLMVHNCNRTIRLAVEKHQGRVIKTIGDGTLATFTNSVDSVRAAIDIQKILTEVNELRPEAERVGVRIGIHYGTGILKSDDVFGDVVNMASRIESEAAAGQIVISDALYRQLEKSNFAVAELGCFLLKGKTSEYALYDVLWKPGNANPAPEKDAVQKVESGGPPLYRLQLVKRDGSFGDKHPVQPQLTIGRSQGDLRFTSDMNMAPLNARVFVQDGKLFVEDLSDGAEKVFVRLVGAHILQTADIIMMGNQVLRFRESAGALSAGTELGISLHDLNDVLERPAAELVQIDAEGKTIKTFALSSVESLFGRTRGKYSFPDDKTMSRVHARIVQRGEDFLLEDIGSRNGTFVSIRTKTPLPGGGAILVGSELFRVEC